MAADAAGLVKPVVKAYALTYLGSAGPRVLGSWRTLRRLDVATHDKLQLIAGILRSGLALDRFPAAAALIVAGATSLPRLVSLVIWARGHGAVPAALQRRLRLLCTFVCAWLAFDLLHREGKETTMHREGKETTMHREGKETTMHRDDGHASRPEYAGKTTGLTLFAACRALDVLAIAGWTRTRGHKWHPEQRTPRLAQLVKTMADTWIFVAANTFIMHAWFYAPERLPKAYQGWISSASELDPRLLEVLRLCRRGDFVYGQDTGCAGALAGVCDEHGLPREWADPAKTIPVPCELYHCGTGKSCEVHALSRWCRGFLFAFKMYLPLQLVVRMQRLSGRAVVGAVKSAARYSAFLATFITLFYYSVCLSRTRLGPRLVSARTVTPQMWDAGLAVLSGCLTCGWSIVIVPRPQRHEFAFFVAPRALATLLPPAPAPAPDDRKFRRREQVVFATSAAVVLTAAHDRAVRGVFGRMLTKVLE